MLPQSPVLFIFHNRPYRGALMRAGPRGSRREQVGNDPSPTALFGHIGGFAMRVFVGMILGALLLFAGVYIYDSQSTSTVASGQEASANRTIVNWDVAANKWDLLKQRAQDDWIKLSSK
jgi:hypothetical protein